MGLSTAAAPDRDEEEEAPARGAQIRRQAVDRRKVVERLFAHEGVDLEGQARGAARARGLERAVEAAGHPPQAVVAGSGGAVQAQRDRVHAGRLEARR